MKSCVALHSNLEDLLRWESQSRGKGTERDEFKRQRLVWHLVTLGGVRPSSKVLSVGCGTGYYEFGVKRYTNSLFCLDYSREMLSICKMRGFKNLIRGSALCLPLRSDAFECVYALSLNLIGSVLATDYTRMKSVQEMKRVVKKGCRIVTGHPTTFWKQLRGLLEHGNPNIEKFRVSPDEVARSYKENGLQALKLMILPPLPYEILKRISYQKLDRPASLLLLSRLGPYMLLSGSK